MQDFLVTGATGQLGRLVVDVLLRDLAPERLAVLVRDPAKAGDLAARGVTLRQGDYTDSAGLETAFGGIERLLLISSSDLAPGNRARQHRAAITAAGRAGVRFLAYTSILHADTSPFGLAADHRDTEAALRASGIAHAVLRNGWYIENHSAWLPGAVAAGVLHGAAGEGRISGATRADYAEAAARVLLNGASEAGRIYELAGDSAYTLSDVAAAAAEVAGKPVAYHDHDKAGFAAVLRGMGLPDVVAEVLSDLDHGARSGTLVEEGGALRGLIGRPPTPLRSAVAAALA
jgi:NAD(P)H dehydrogenase (quinone)